MRDSATKLIKAACAFLLLVGSLALLAPVFTASAEREPGGQVVQSDGQKGEAAAPMQRIEPVAVAVINFKKLAEAEAKKRASGAKEPPELIVIHPPLSIPEPPGPISEKLDTTPKQDEGGGPLIPSPAASQSFQGIEDNGGSIPPDTTGAVGPDKIFVNVNGRYRVLNKSTGATLTTVSMTNFWAPLNTPTPVPPTQTVSGIFDPRVQYDPYNGRWIMAAVSNSSNASASVLVGISATSDPQGTFTLFRFVVGCAGTDPGCNSAGEWADFPMLGFNKNWVAVGWNQFPQASSSAVGGKMLIIDYTAMRAGTPNPTSMISTVANTTVGFFCMHPATTLSATEETLYVPVHVSSASATYRLHKITGTPSAPTLVLDTVSRTRAGGAWVQPGGDIMPQTCVGTPGTTCPTTIRFIDSNDAFLRNNVVFRNGSIWYSQTIGLPAGGLTHTAVQWTRINTSGTFVDGGRVEDPAANATTGEWYAYSSLAVNANNDVLFGFSTFSATHFVNAGYAFRAGTDAAGTMRDPVIFKNGEDYYSKEFSGTRNRWGDYSHSVVDPSNDLDMWTIQEYAGTRILQDSQQTTNNSRWGTWWAKIPDQLSPPPSPTPTPSPPSNDRFVDAHVLNGCSGSVTGTNLLGTRETGEPSHDPANNPGASSVWYQWQAPASGSVTMTTIGSNFDTLLGVYTGNAVNGLSVIIKNDDIVSGIDRQSSVTFSAIAGTVYKIAVDGWGGESGNIVLNWNLSNCPALSAGIQFTLTSYGVNESQDFVTLTVTRSDTSGAANVNYATSDTAGLQNCTLANGRASERCDYVTSLGTVRFVAGESSKTFIVPIINDVHVEGPETFTVTLSNPVGGSLGSQSGATVTIVDNDFTASSQNPIDGVEFFILQQYRDILNRQPDSTGFQNWVNTLGPCPNGGFGEPPTSNCDRLHVASGFFQSEEFLSRGYFAFRFYMVSFGQRPTYAQFIPDMAQVGGPKSPAEEETSKVAYANAFVQRPEFLTRYGSQSGQTLANSLLTTAGLPPGSYNAGSQTNGQILRGIAETSAAFNKFLTEGTVSIMYFGFQRRDPDAVGYQNNLNTLNADPNNLRHMIFIFIYSTEYRQRFGP